MVMQVNQALCAGCGICVEVCSAGAIKLVANWAVIDKTLCTGCEACLDACPNGAITAIARPEPINAMTTLPAVKSRPALAQVQDRLGVITAPVRGLAPLAGTALAYFGREIAPRMVDVFIDALERRLARPENGVVSSSSIPIQSPGVQRRGKRRQARFRGKKINSRNLQGRR
jgi:NAD-dependent dihydropyrimidine dehydrogenase PreA subunit